MNFGFVQYLQSVNDPGQPPERIRNGGLYI